MPKEIKSKRQILEAVKNVPGLRELLSKEEGHFKYEIDLEVMVYGRNYGGKMVGPYLRLLEYSPKETIVKEGEWGGNTFYYVVDPFVDVLVDLPEKGVSHVGTVASGFQFGEMSVLAGVPRSATIQAPEGQNARVLEVQRPALRLLRKIPELNQALDSTYRKVGKKAVFSELRRVTNLTPEWLDILSSCARFRIFAKNHTLFSQNTLMNRIYLIRSGWIRRFWETGEEELLGKGYCFGLEGLATDYSWPFSLMLLERSEVLEMSISKIRKDPGLVEVVQQQFAYLGPPDPGALYTGYTPPVAAEVLRTQKDLTDTGLASATNLLVMDMDLCVRCGNCSLACQKVHGHSRLLREGIHLNRLKKPAISAVQSLLSPAVCMHCKDPECTTGCPTGAIGRAEGGQVDIINKLCIGCGDCATQCPYNAISLVPKRKKEEPKKKGWKAIAENYLRIRKEPLPAEVETTEDLLAVKCNLCAGTTLNPAGSKSQAYSCEQNCPTGALVRVNPKEYFNELTPLEGLAFQSPTQAYGRNIHVSDPTRTLVHGVGLALLALVIAFTILGLRIFGLGGKIFWFMNMRWTTGLIGLAAIIGVMLYPARRQVYTKRGGPLRYWLQSHAYLGAIAAFVIFAHGGTDTGGFLTTALMVSFDFVTFTGIFGILCYVAIPRLMTKIEDEPLLIDSLLVRKKELQDEIARLASGSASLNELVQKRILPRFTSFGYLLRQYLVREDLDQLIQKALRDFQQLQVTQEEREALDQILTSCVLLRRIDSLIYLHRILKLWLPPHVISTSLMLALMLVHVVQVIYFAR